MIHILIVEDDDFIREKVVSFVEKFTKLKTVEATSGNAAIELLKKQRFSLIISDYHMEDGNGESLLRYLEDNKQPTPFIFHTAAITVDLSFKPTIEPTIVEKFDFEDLKEAIVRNLFAFTMKKSGMSQ